MSVANMRTVKLKSRTFKKRVEQAFDAYRARELRPLEGDFDKAMKTFLKKDGE